MLGFCKRRDEPPYPALARVGQSTASAFRDDMLQIPQAVGSTRPLRYSRDRDERL